MVESDKPEAEIQQAMDIIGPTLEIFDKISDIDVPIDTTFKRNVYITSSSDPRYLTLKMILIMYLKSMRKLLELN